jgi:Family of unknown function (DUF6281)
MRAPAISRGRQTILSIALVLLTGCSGAFDEGTSGNGGSGSCSLRARLKGGWYVGSGGIVVIPAYGDLLGSAVVSACGDENGFRIAAYRIRGVSPQIAFASPQYEDAVFVAEGIGSFPHKVQRLRHEPKCASEDAPILLRGQWLGIIGADG